MNEALIIINGKSIVKGIKYKPKSFEEDLEHNSEEYDESK
jgi:hypothetical protein